MNAFSKSTSDFLTALSKQTSTRSEAQRLFERHASKLMLFAILKATADMSLAVIARVRAGPAQAPAPAVGAAAPGPIQAHQPNAEPLAPVHDPINIELEPPPHPDSLDVVGE